MNGCCRCFVGTSLVLRSSRTIACGQSVSENYGPLFTHKSQTDRQTSLKGRYWFQCRCQPCTSRWPMYDGQFKISFIFSFNQFNCLYLVKSILMYMFFLLSYGALKLVESPSAELSSSAFQPLQTPHLPHLTRTIIVESFKSKYCYYADMTFHIKLTL